jgi:prevent-host-death family protein
MSTVSVRDLRNHSADMLARVARGETLTVTRDGEPVARVAPLPRRAVSVDELIARRRTLPHVDAAALRADVDELIDPLL